MKKLEIFSTRLVVIWSLLILAFASITSFIWTRKFPADYAEEIPYVYGDMIWLTIPTIFSLIAAFYVVGKWLTQKEELQEKRLRILCVGTLGFCVLFGSIWVMISSCEPVADQKMVMTTAGRFIQENYGRLDYEGYLFALPHQLTLTACMEVLYRMVGIDNYVALQFLNVVAATLSIYFGYKITRKLSLEIKVAGYYLCLSATCFPLFFYTTFVYAELFSLMLSLLAIWMFLEFMEKRSFWRFGIIAISLCIAMLFRNNSVIIMVAMGCCFFVKGILEKNIKMFLAILAMVMLFFGAKAGIEKMYEVRSGHELNEGAPMILWLVMGLQDNEKEAGWFNSYPNTTYQGVYAYDRELSAKQGEEDFQELVENFVQNPMYTLDFFQRKFTSQWNDPTFGCFIMTTYTESERGALATSVFSGFLNRLFILFMNGYQSLVYLGATFYLWSNRKEKKFPVEQVILMIVILGGALFHTFWEAKSRYVFPYFFCMLPLCGMGLDLFLKKIKIKIESIKK